MAYLSAEETKTLEWFQTLQKEGEEHCQAIRLDPYGSIVMALPAEPTAAAAAWLAYIATLAAKHEAKVSLAAHGVLVLVFARYARPEQKALELPLTESQSRPEGR